MTTDTLDYLPGNLVRARGREWVVQADTHPVSYTHLTLPTNREV